MFQSDVVVQPAGMVLLDDKSEAVSLLIWRPGRYGLWCLRRISHAPVGREPIAEAGSQWCKQITNISESRDYFLVFELPQFRVFQFLPRSRRGNPRPLPTTQ
jgi:hypothetical protein